MLERIAQLVAAPEAMPEQADVVGRHLTAMPWRTRKDLMHRDAVEWDGMLAVLTGMKPAYLFDEDNAQIALSLIPPDMAGRFGIAGNDWLYDAAAIARTVKRYAGYFPEVRAERLGDAAYVHAIVEARTAVSTEDIDPAEIAKTGLLLGFPERSVRLFAFGGIGPRMGFSRHGYAFSASPADIVPFTMALDRRAKATGYERLRADQQRDVAAAFRAALADAKPTVGVVEVLGERFIAVEGVVDGDTLIDQLVLLSPEPGTLRHTATLVEAFGAKSRLGAYSLRRSADGVAHRMGVAFEGTVEHIRRHSGADTIPYLQASETPASVEAKLYTIEKGKLVSWAMEHVRHAVDALDKPSGEACVDVTMDEFLMGKAYAARVPAASAVL